MVPGDYDGDSQMDVLLTAQSNSRISIFIFWGHNQTLGTSELRTAEGFYFIIDLAFVFVDHS